MYTQTRPGTCDCGHKEEKMTLSSDFRRAIVRFHGRRNYGVQPSVAGGAPALLSFVAKRFRGKDTGGRPRGIHGGDEGDTYSHQSYDEAVYRAGSKGNVIDGVDLGRKGKYVVMSSDPGEGVAEYQGDASPDHSDQQTLRDEKTAHLRLAGSHRNKDGDVASLLHDHHGERDQDVQGGYKDDEADGDKRHETFQAQGTEDGLVLLHPIVGHEALARALFQLLGDRVCSVDVIDFELQHGNQVAETKKLLRIG